MLSSRNDRSRSTAFRLAVVVVGMFGFGFLMVPIYNVFCDLTGLNGNTTQVKTASSDLSYAVDQSRTVKVQFVANLNEQMQWAFEPAVFEMEVHPGQAYTTEFYAKNLRPETMIGQAIPSVMPSQASLHFHKTECFCFIQQSFAGNERRVMPVTFVIDPKLPRKVHTVTLAYTFFDITQSAQTQSDSHDKTSNGG